MAGTDDKFNRPKLTLPPDFLRRLNLSSDFVQRFNTLASVEVKQGLEQLAQRLQQQHPFLQRQIYEKICLIRRKRKELAALDEEVRHLESWLDSELGCREAWDSATSSVASADSAPTPAPSAPQEQLPEQLPSKEWRHGEELDWLKWVMETYPQRPKESQNKWGKRLYNDYMKKAFGANLGWEEATVHRRMRSLRKQAKSDQANQVNQTAERGKRGK